MRGSVKVMNSDLRYPIGRFSPPKSVSPEERKAVIQSITDLPKNLRAAVHGLNQQQIDTPYREGGWTVRQTVHHIADSHMQGSIRIRLALTDDWPRIITYRQERWAELPDTKTLPVEVSLELLEGLQARWAELLRSISSDDWSQRGCTHPEHGRQSVESIAALYAWHGRHHTAHITALRQRMGWPQVG